PGTKRRAASARAISRRSTPRTREVTRCSASAFRSVPTEPDASSSSICAFKGRDLATRCRERHQAVADLPLQGRLERIRFCRLRAWLGPEVLWISGRASELEWDEVILLV